ncbi:MAG: DUF6498-containing protein [Casimicrobiaceae bacterium]
MNPLVSPIGIAQIVARNITPLAGILFFGWSASSVLILYFVDTLLSMAVIFAGLARSFTPATDGMTAKIKSNVTFIFVALLLTAFFAIPLGMPIGIVLATGAFSWRFALYDESLRLGVIVQCIIALGSYVELYRALGTHTPEQLQLKQRFGLVLMRWVVVMSVCYTGLGYLGDYGVFLLVAAYISASIFAEIAPDRFLRGTPADPTVEAKHSPRMAQSLKSGKRNR